MMTSLKSDFLRAISIAGIKPPQNAVIDGQIHRFSTNDKIGDNAGWYVLKNHGDFTFGAFGDWRTGIQGKWSSKDESQMSEVEKDEMWSLMCCLLYTSPSPRDRTRSRMPSSA